MFGLFKREKRPGNKVSKKFFAIQSVHSGNLLDAAQGKANADAVMWKDNGGENQQFTLTPNGKGQYRIKNRATKQYLTVSGNQKGARVVFRNGEQSPNQYFTLEEVDDRTYTLKTCFGFYVDVENADKHKGAHVIQWEGNKGKNQMWRMQDPKDVTSSSDQWEGGW